MLIDPSTLKATIILLILKDRYDDFYLTPKTYANGREVGFKLQSRTNHTADKNAFVAIMEDRHSDSIRLVSGDWIDFDINEVAKDGAKAKYFGPHQYAEAAEYVFNVLTNPAE